MRKRKLRGGRKLRKLSLRLRLRGGTDLQRRHVLHTPVRWKAVRGRHVRRELRRLPEWSELPERRVRHRRQLWKRNLRPGRELRVVRRRLRLRAGASLQSRKLLHAKLQRQTVWPQRLRRNLRHLSERTELPVERYLPGLRRRRVPER